MKIPTRIVRIPRSRGEAEQLGSPFLRRELDFHNEEVKHPHRDGIAQFFKEHLDSSIRPRCFSLPGVRWSFERVFDKAMGSGITQFVGVERNYTIMKKGLEKIIGNHLLYRPDKDRNLEGYISTRSRIYLCPASKFLGLPNNDKVWQEKNKNFTLAWLDLSAYLCTETLLCCERIENSLHPQAEVVPVVVTYMIGREKPNIFQLFKRQKPGVNRAAIRSDFLKSCWKRHNKLRSVEVVESLEYPSAAGRPMGLTLALFKLKK